MTNSMLDAFVPAEKTKSMSDLDEEDEAWTVKSHREKAKEGLVGVMDWAGAKIKDGGVKKV